MVKVTSLIVTAGSGSTDVESDFSLDILKPNGKNSEVTEAHKFAHVSSIAII